MEFSLDNPGLEMDVSDQVDIHQSDVSGTSLGSSASLGESTLCSCSRCHGRMSSFFLDRHMFCIKCRGSDCDQNTRCDECLSWKNKNPLKSSSSPRSTAPVVDLDSRFAVQLDTVNKSMDDKLSAMSSALLSQFTVMLDQFKLGITISSVSGNHGVPGYSVSQTEPPSLRHPVSTEIQRLRFQDGGEDPVPHGLGIAQGGGVPLARPQLGKDAAASGDPPAEGSENVQWLPGLSGPKVWYHLRSLWYLRLLWIRRRKRMMIGIVSQNLRSWIRLCLGFLTSFMTNLQILVLLLVRPLLHGASLRSILPFLTLRRFLVRIFRSTSGFWRSLMLAPRKLPVKRASLNPYIE